MSPELPQSADNVPTQLDLGFQRAIKRYLDAWQATTPQTAQTPTPTINPTLHPAEAFFSQPPPTALRCRICSQPFPTLDALGLHVAHHHTPLTTYLPPSPSVAPSPLRLRCSVCHIACDTPAQLARHNDGQKHRKKADWQRAFLAARATFDSEGIRPLQDDIWCCIFCNAYLHSQNSLMQHVEGAKHARARQAATGTVNSPAPIPLQPSQPPRRNVTTPSPPRQIALPISKRPADPSTRHVPLTALLAAESSSETSMDARLVRTAIATPSTTPPSSSSSPPITTPTSLGPVLTAIPRAPARTPIFPCVTCGVCCNSRESLNAHFASAKHRRKITAAATSSVADDLTCTLCGITCTAADNLTAHLASVKHKRKAAAAAGAAATGETEGVGTATGVGTGANASDLHCAVCDVWCTAADNLTAHLKGKLHAKKVRMALAAAEKSADK